MDYGEPCVFLKTQQHGVGGGSPVSAIVGGIGANCEPPRLLIYYYICAISIGRPLLDFAESIPLCCLSNSSHILYMLFVNWRSMPTPKAIMRGGFLVYHINNWCFDLLSKLVELFFDWLIAFLATETQIS
jgi:hypothetical protein